MSNTLPSFKTFAGLEGPLYSSFSPFLLLVLFTVVVSLKNKRKKHLSQGDPLQIYSHLLEARISNFLYKNFQDSTLFTTVYNYHLVKRRSVTENTPCLELVICSETDRLTI